MLTAPPDSHGAETMPSITNEVLITIATAHSALRLQVATDGRLYQVGYAAAGAQAQTPEAKPPREVEFYPPSGDGFILEPALAVTHSDGNASTDLRFVKQARTELGTNIVLTRIELKDGFYPLSVTLCFKAYQAEDVI